MSAGQDSAHSARPGEARLSGPVAAIAARYADALFDLAMEEGALEAVEKDLGALRAAIGASPDLRQFLASPLYDAEEKSRAVAAIAAKAGFGALTRNVLLLIAKNRRLFALDALIAAFFARLAAHRGEVAAEAVAAAPLNEDETKRLRTEIETIVGKAVNLTTRVDPDILGGLVVKVGSMMIDSSLRAKLNRLKSVMKEA